MDKTRLWIVFITVINTILSLESAKILGIFPTYCRSHNSVSQPIVKGLAARGHNVTVISHFKTKSNLNNYEEVIFGDDLRSYVDTISVNETVVINRLLNYFNMLLIIEYEPCKEILEMDILKKIINSKEKSIDLIIAQVFHSTCYNLLAHYLNIPLVIILPSSLFVGTDIMIGNPNNPSYVPLVTRPYTTKMTFWQRLTNTFYYVVENVAHYYYFNHYMGKISEEYFNIELPSYDALHKRVSLAFYNNHFSFLSRPLVPNAIDIAGIHIEEPKSLSTEIQRFLDSAKNGVIFFSFGTTIKASSMNPEKIKIFKEVFSSIPQKIIWRTNELNFTDLPSNIMTGQWFPQRDILEHKNVKAFISHCGLLGTLEAIHTETPVIGIPFRFDQFQNINILADREAGLYIDYEKMDKNILHETINQIINNTKYANNMKKMSKIFKDRPMSPLKTALYWTEYVLRHDGAHHTRNENANIPFYQYLLLDVIATAVLLLLFLMYLSYWIIVSIFSYFKNVNKKIKQL